MQLRFERLTVYRKALEMLDVVIALQPLVPRGKGLVFDHAEQAAWSVILNLSEGSCEFSRGDKRKFYRYALRSSGECIGAFTILAKYPGPHQELCRKGAALAQEIVLMITRMIVGPRNPNQAPQAPSPRPSTIPPKPKPG